MQIKLNEVRLMRTEVLTQSWKSGLVFTAGGGFDIDNKAELKSTKECPCGEAG